MDTNVLQEYLSSLEKSGSLANQPNEGELISEIEAGIKEKNSIRTYEPSKVLANYYLASHQYEKAAKVCLESLKVIIEPDERHAELHYLMGRIRMYQGMYGNSVEHLFHALRIAELNLFERLEARIYSGLASISRFLKHFDKAIGYAKKALLLSEKHHDYFNLSETHMGLGIVYNKLNDLDKATSSLTTARKYGEKLQNKELNCSIQKSLGDTFHHFSLLDQAEESYNEALILLDAIDNDMMKTMVHVRLADCYLQRGLIDQSIIHAHEAQSVSQAAEFLQGQSESEFILGRLYEIQEDHSKAYGHLKRHIEVNDKIAGRVDPSSLARSESGYLIELKEKEIKLLRAVEVHHQEIQDSIDYSRKIQEAILPNREYISKALPNSFIHYAPKDTVSGDFYWYHVREDKIFLASADCTGHGIPGALVSMLCHDILNQVIIDQKLNDPGKILTEVNQRVAKIFKSNLNKTKANDGMDISLCMIDRKNNKLSFSGAINSICKIRNGVLEEFRGTRFAIGGGTPEETQFESIAIDCDVNDWFYIYTDGFQDQFGGPKGKKFMAKNFRRLLIKLSTLELKDQPTMLAKTFEDWAGDNEQVDDVLVIGFQLG